MKPLTRTQATEIYMCEPCKSGMQCGFDCVASETCSFKCEHCGTSNYFPGNLENAPESFRCVDCGYTIFNKYRKPEHWDDPTQAPLTWGTTVIPLSEWIDPAKSYTCGGKKVVNIHIELYNSAGEEVTYPVKGTVIIREKPLKTAYRIWTLNGIGDVVWGGNDKDLIEVKEVSH